MRELWRQWLRDRAEVRRITAELRAGRHPGLVFLDAVDRDMRDNPNRPGNLAAKAEGERIARVIRGERVYDA
jgi:hypothetical protein